jgi:hypothetical protein
VPGLYLATQPCAEAEASTPNRARLAKKRVRRDFIESTFQSLSLRIGITINSIRIVTYFLLNGKRMRVKKESPAKEQNSPTIP